MLEIKNLSICSGENFLVQDLSLSLPDTGITALIGPSGCGKSSVLKWLCGILSPSLKATGTALLDNDACQRPNRDIAYQPQGDALFPWLTIAENAALGLRVTGMSTKVARERVIPLFTSFGLAGTHNMFPAELSGGMRQRAAFLRTMILNSRYMLLDEPFSALDAVTRLRMQSWLCERLRESAHSALLVTHDLHEATSLADRILVMSANPGRIIAEIPVNLSASMRSESTLAELRDHLKTLLLE